MRRSFETFAVCTTNETAFTAARAREKNPLFIEGPWGSGKTHLLDAIAHELRAEGLTVDRLDVRSFVRRLAQSYSFEMTSAPADALLIDDFGLIADGSTQASLLIEFDRNAKRGVFVAVTTHRPLPNVEAVMLGYPDAATATEIARRTALTRGFALHDRELAEVARIEHNPRAIEGIVTRMAFAKLTT